MAVEEERNLANHKITESFKDEVYFFFFYFI